MRIKIIKELSNKTYGDKYLTLDSEIDIEESDITYAKELIELGYAEEIKNNGRTPKWEQKKEPAAEE